MHFADRAVSLDKVIATLVEALGSKDPGTKQHSLRVATIAVAFALDCGLNLEELEVVQAGGLLHDIGKIGVPESILNKPGKPNRSELEKLRLHPSLGHKILSHLAIGELQPLVRSHHERVDGQGYPDGIDNYPLLVRILQLADVWDALTSRRSYHDGMSPAKARALMSKPCEFGFDPLLCRQFISFTRRLFPDIDSHVEDYSRTMCDSESGDVENNMGL